MELARCADVETHIGLMVRGRGPTLSRFRRRPEHHYDRQERFYVGKTDPKQFDAIVIGGGPAGSTAGTILAQHGRNVVLFEKEKMPRYHIGESMLPFNFFPLQRVGVIDQLNAGPYVKKHSVQFVSQDGKTSQPFYFADHFDHEAAVTWQVERTEFDTMLLNNAREKGVTVLEQTSVIDAVEEDGCVVGAIATDSDGEKTAYRAPITIDCSGRAGFTMTRNKWRVADAKLKKIAIWTYFKGAKRAAGRDEGATTISYLPAKGWFWYIPLANDKVSVGVVADKDYLFSETRDYETILWREIEKTPWIQDRIKDGIQTGGYNGTADYSYHSQYCAKDGVVLAGDAFSFLDPIFSSGIFLALVSGEMAADAVNTCFDTGDFSAAQFTEFSRKFRQGSEVMRKFVYAFYDEGFNFGTIVKNYPHLRGDLTDCLIGNVFKNLDDLFTTIGKYVELPPTIDYGEPFIREAVTV